MPLKCCVTGCLSNYKNTDDQHVTIYKCPKQPVELWKSKIPRKDIIIDENSRVCIKHFDERFLICEYVFTGSDGKKYSEQRKFPKPTANAYSFIFPNLPSYLSESLPPPRKTPDQRRAEIDERETIASSMSIFLVIVLQVAIHLLVRYEASFRRWMKTICGM